MANDGCGGRIQHLDRHARRVEWFLCGSEGDGVTKPEPRATLIMLDGAAPDVFEELAAAGDLPNISRHVLEPGGSVPATTAFPSTTGVAYLPFLTGYFPGPCGVPGIRWMDSERYRGKWWRDRDHVRSYCGVQRGKLNSDLPDGMQSLFDIEQDSFALCSPYTRGLPAERYRTRLSRIVVGSLCHYTRSYKLLDRMIGRDFVELALRKYRFVFAVFPGVDGLAHNFEPRHPKVLDLYREFDETIGRYVAAGGLEENHFLAIVSDHGLTRIDRHTDVAEVLEDRGIRVLRHPTIWRRNPQVAVMVSGNASAQVYLRPGVSRSHRWSIPHIESGQVDGIPTDLVEFLANLDGVALVAGVDGADVVVVSREGRARLVDLGDGRIKYDPETADVLELGGFSATKHERDWLAYSMDCRFPDAPAQLLQLFRSDRTGDLVLSATEHADLRDDWEFPEHRAGHGGLTREHMRCVVAINRPLKGPKRSADVFGVILNHLGHAEPSGIDGQISGLRIPLAVQ
jgi:hypothetical protein